MKKSGILAASAADMMATAPKAVMAPPRMDASDTAAMLREIKQMVEKNTSDTSQAAERAIKEARNAGEMSAETKDTVDQLLKDQGQLSNMVSKLEKRLEEADTAQLDLEQRLSGRGAPAAGAGMTVGQQVINADAVKAFGGKGTVTVDVQNAITTTSGSGGDLRQPYRDPEVVGLPQQQLLIRDLIPSVQVDTSSVEYARQTTRDNQAAAVAEGGLKPESDLAWEQQDAPIRTIAHWFAVSRQAMDDLPQLQGMIDTEGRYGLNLVEDAQLLAGDGIGQNLSGLITNATAYSGAAESKITNPTVIDKLRVAMLEATLGLYPADGIILNPEDWMVIETQKDADNRYIFANPVGMAGPVLWGRRVVPSLSMAVDKFLVGAFGVAATIYDRMGTEVAISSEDRDNFVKNMLTVRVEKRLGLAVKRQAALIYGDFGLVA